MYLPTFVKRYFDITNWFLQVQDFEYGFFWKVIYELELNKLKLNYNLMIILLGFLYVTVLQDQKSCSFEEAPSDNWFMKSVSWCYLDLS